MKNLLSPDKSNFIIKLYHKSNKLLIPLLIPSIFLDNNNDYKKYFNFLNITNFSFHSNISFSTIITDYHKKIPFINVNYLRFFNFKIHSIIYLYFTYNLFNKTYRPEIFLYNNLKRRETLSGDYYSLNRFDD